jgi:hypothetical protein
VVEKTMKSAGHGRPGVLALRRFARQTQQSGRLTLPADNGSLAIA